MKSIKDLVQDATSTLQLVRDKLLNRAGVEASYVCLEASALDKVFCLRSDLAAVHISLRESELKVQELSTKLEEAKRELELCREVSSEEAEVEKETEALVEPKDMRTLRDLAQQAFTAWSIAASIKSRNLDVDSPKMKEFKGGQEAAEELWLKAIKEYEAGHFGDTLYALRAATATARLYREEDGPEVLALNHVYVTRYSESS